MGQLDIEAAVRGSIDAWKRAPLKYLILGLLAVVVPAVVGGGVLVAIWGPAILILIGMQDPSAQEVRNALDPMLQDPGNLVEVVGVLIGGFAVAMIAIALVWTLFYGALLARSRGTDETGRDVASSLRTAADRFPSLLGVVLIVTLVVLALVGVPGAFVAWAFFQAAAGSGLGALTGAGVAMLAAFGGAIVALFLILAWFVAPPAVLFEGETAFGALSRSWELTRGERLPLFALVLVGIVAGFLIGIVVEVGMLPITFLAPRAAFLTSFVSGTISAPIWPLLSTRAWEQLADVEEPAPASSEGGAKAPPDDTVVSLGER